MDVDNVYKLVTAYTGYAIPDTDKPIIEYMMKNETQSICNLCNVAEIPDELAHIAYERAAGQYLAAKLKEIAGEDGVNVVTSVKEGDTQVQFSGKSNADRLNELIGTLTRDRMGEILRFRRLVW